MTTISERARQKLQPREMASKDIPIEDQWREAAERWVKLDEASRLLDETKTSVLAERINQYVIGQGGNVAHNRAEAAVKSSPEWREFLTEMVRARTEANKARIQMDWLKMRFEAWRSRNANARQERKM